MELYTYPPHKGRPALDTFHPSHSSTTQAKPGEFCTSEQFTNETCTGCHLPRLAAVGTPLLLSSSAMPRRVVMPAACISAWRARGQRLATAHAVRALSAPRHDGEYSGAAK
jgi:hypothetical protein